MAHVFPAGRIGTALLLLRVQAALFALQWAIQNGTAQAWLVGAIALMGLCIAVGIFTRPAAFLFCFVTIASVLRSVLAPAAIWQTFDLAALGFAGAGAFSIDSWLFGRLIIRLRP